MIIPPTLQLLLFGFALDSTVSHLRLGVIDWSQTPESRELISTLTESKSFQLGGTIPRVDQARAKPISRGKLDAGIVIPYEFARDLHARHAGRRAIPAERRQRQHRHHRAGLCRRRDPVLQPDAAHRGYPARGSAPWQRAAATAAAWSACCTAFLYNPGLVNAWFIVTGTFGVLLILNGSLLAATAMVKERERGTVEQLLMTPASTTDIVIAKIAPLFVLLMVMATLAIGVMRLFFDVPVRGSVVLLALSAGLCILSGIGIGTVVATFTKSAQQAMMTASSSIRRCRCSPVRSRRWKPCRPGCSPSPG